MTPAASCRKEVKLALLAALLAPMLQASSVTSPPSLAGNWIVDLSTKSDLPYTRLMELTLNPNGTVSGLFY